MSETSTATIDEAAPDAIGQDVIERKAFNFEVKDLGDGADGNGTFAVYAAEFSTIDRAGEKIAPDAFKNLDAFIRDGFFALGHDLSGMPLGTITSAVADSKGLLVTGEFHSTPAAQHARTVMRERRDRGKSVKLSIGYVVLKDAQAAEAGRKYRLLKALNLFEVSWVNIPANPAAEAVSVKGHPPMPTAEATAETTAAPATPETKAPETKAPETKAPEAPEPAPAPDPTPADPPPVGSKEAPPIETKGPYLGDTDEAMVCAALDRVHSTLGYYLMRCVRSDLSVADTVTNATGAIDEYKATVLPMFRALLVDKDPADAAAATGGPVAMDGYGYMALSPDALATKYLAKLATLDTSPDGSVTDLSFDDSSRRLVTGLVEFHADCVKQHGIRTKAGRVLSASTRKRIDEVLKGIRPMVDELQALLDEATPPEKAAPPVEAKAAPDGPPPPPPAAADAEAGTKDAPEATDPDGLFAEFLALEARLMGVPA